MGRVIRAVKSGWNLFRDAPVDPGFGRGNSMGYHQSRASARTYSDGSFVRSIYNRLAVDFSTVEFMHVLTDENGVALSIVNDSLNNCLTLDPNIDQTAQALKQDYANMMFEQGHACLVPVDSDQDPNDTASYNIKQLRVGRVVKWHPQRVTIEVYDDREVDDDGNPPLGGSGIWKQMTVHKDIVCIQQNPFYNVMNMPNGLLQRLLRKLAILDSIDEAAGSGKLDLIFQLPYMVRGESRQKQAEERRAMLADQLKDDELGIGYIDVSEKVIQLNRPIDNKMIDQIELLMSAAMDELGLTKEIMNGSADRDTINNYFDRTIEPIANGAGLEMRRKFISKTARTQNHSIMIYRDPLKLIPIKELAEVADKLLRNAAVTANELRPKIGLMPSKDPRANELMNPNMPKDDQVEGAKPPDNKAVKSEGLPEDPP